MFLLILYIITFILKVNKVCSFLNSFHEVRSFLLYIFYFIYIIWIILIKIISVIVIFKFIIIFLNVVIYSYSHIYCIFSFLFSLTGGDSGVIMGELLVSKRGLGYLIMYGSQVFNINLVITSVFILGIIAYLMYKLITIIENKYNKNNQ